MSAREWLDAAQERADAAHDEVVRLCEGGRFTMTAPVEDTDSDVVLDAPTEDLPLAIAALRAVLDLTSGWQPATMPRAIEAAITAALNPAATREQTGETP